MHIAFVLVYFSCHNMLLHRAVLYFVYVCFPIRSHCGSGVGPASVCRAMKPENKNKEFIPQGGVPLIYFFIFCGVFKFFVNL